MPGIPGAPGGIGGGTTGGGISGGGIGGGGRGPSPHGGPGGMGGGGTVGGPSIPGIPSPPMPGGVAPTPTIPAPSGPSTPGGVPRDKFTTTSITGGKITIPVGPPPVLPKDPTPGVGNVGEEVATKTEEAKTRRVECTRATERLHQQKEIIGKQTTELKADIATNKAALETC